MMYRLSRKALITDERPSNEPFSILFMIVAKHRQAAEQQYVRQQCNEIAIKFSITVAEFVSDVAANT